MIYYVDSCNGDDCRDGRSPVNAWKTLKKVNATTFRPGDRILFCAGCTFEGQLHPLGDGTQEQPIVIGSYGAGARPCIDGCGSCGTREGNYTDGAAVLFYNQNYWELQDLEITNFNPWYQQEFEYTAGPGAQQIYAGMARVDPAGGPLMLRMMQGDRELVAMPVTAELGGDMMSNRMILSPKNRCRYGVLVRWHNYGTGHHIHIRNCHIHDVNGEKRRLAVEGILVVSTGTEGGVPTNFNDVLLENNVVEDIDHSGIVIWSAWAEGRGIDYHGDVYRSDNFYHTTVGPWKGSTNVVVRGNKVCRTAGDAILINTTIGALIEKNYVEHCCYEMRIGYNAAVWPHNADGTIVQFNEVCYTHGVQDGQAFDIDLSCNDTVIRYNHSHHNEGGFLLLMNQTTNNEIHHNISEHDRNGLIWNHENHGGTRIHDNLFYLSMENVQVFRGPYDSDDWVFENNTFCARVPDTHIEWKPRAKYSGNNYYNIANLPEDPNPRCEKPEHISF